MIAIAALLFVATAVIGTSWVIARGGAFALLNSPDAWQLQAAIRIPYFAVFALFGTILGAVLGRRLSAGKAAITVFIGGYLVLNLIFYLAWTRN